MFCILIIPGSNKHLVYVIIRISSTKYLLLSLGVMSFKLRCNLAQWRPGGITTYKADFNENMSRNENRQNIILQPCQFDQANPYSSFWQLRFVWLWLQGWFCVITHFLRIFHISHYSVGQNVIIQAIHVNYTSWYGKLSENYAESKKWRFQQIFSTVTYL